MISAHADYSRDDFVFPRTQSREMQEARWEQRVEPLRSWGEIIAAGLVLGIACLALVLSSALV